MPGHVPEIVRIDNLEKLRERATAALSQFLKESKDIPVLLMLSGGSAMELLDDISLEYIGKNTTITMLDDRFSRELDVNNFAQFSETMFCKVAIARGTKFISTVPKESETLQGFSTRLDSELKSWVKLHPAGKIIAVIGVGPDAHTAGIMPYSEALLSKSWVVGYDAGEKNVYPQRATVSATFMRDKIDGGVVYVRGATKKDALNKLISEGSLNEAPARIMREMKNVKVFTDIPQ
ncbi:MAG: 6-phosphogluconolactonase [Candidatus Colwellbacteria bacterium]|nr:6-phosphogluconolactonase [Candidatus Colwellbacteria bacterium]